MALVLTEDRGAVRHLVLNRPEKRNALNGDAIRGEPRYIEALPSRMITTSQKAGM